MHACMHTLICRLFQYVCCREQGVVDTCMCWTSAISMPEAALYFGTVERRACENRKLLTPLWHCAGVGKPFFTFGTEPPACQLQCWSLEPYLKQWLLQEEATRNMPAKGATGAFLGSLVSTLLRLSAHACTC